jgi:Bacterial membrane protein YfhO
LLSIGSACLALALIAFYFPWLSGQRVFFFKDSTHFFEPLCRFIGAALRNGHIPLWNPYGYCGMSQAAISSPSIFFPPNWLFAVMSFSQATAAIMIISQLVCAIGMFLIIEFLGWGVVPSVIAAATVALSGYMFSLTSNYTLPVGAGWAPLTLYFTLRCLHTPSLRWLVGNALSIFMMISSGRPEICVPVLLMVAILGAMTRKSELRNQLDFFKSLVIGVLLAMPTVLPILEWTPLSRRSAGLPTQEILLYSSNWYDLLNVAVCQPLDNFQLRNSAFSNVFAGISLVPYYDSAFVGTIVLALAIMGVSRSGGVKFRSTVALLFLSILLALGQNVPGMGELVTSIPVASWLRFPSKLLFFAVLAIGFLAARGAMLYERRQIKLLPHMVGWGVIVISAMALALSRTILLPLSVAAGQALMLTAQSTIAWRTAAQAIPALLSVGTMWLCLMKNQSRTALSLVSCCVVLSLFLNAAFASTIAAPFDYYQQPLKLSKQVPFPVGSDSANRVMSLVLEQFTVPSSLASPDRLQSTINDFQYSRQMLKGFTNIDFKLLSPFGFEGSMIGEYYYYFLNTYIQSSQSVHSDNGEPTNDVPLYQLLQMTSTKYVVTQARRQRSPAVPASVIPLLDGSCFDLLFEDLMRNVRVYALKETLPRAYLTRTWMTFSNRDKLLKFMLDPSKNSFQPTFETLIESNIDVAPAMSDNLDLTVPVQLESAQPEEIQMSVSVKGQRQLLVLQDQYYPGWNVEVDGHPEPIIRCNGFMRGVMLHSGSHKVRFFYRPKSVLLGWALAFLGVLWFTAMFIARRTRPTHR